MKASELWCALVCMFVCVWTEDPCCCCCPDAQLRAQVWAPSRSRLFWSSRKLERFKHPERDNLRPQQNTVSQSIKKQPCRCCFKQLSFTDRMLQIVSCDIDRLIIWTWTFLQGNVRRKCEETEESFQCFNHPGDSYIACLYLKRLFWEQNVLVSVKEHGLENVRSFTMHFVTLDQRECRDTN